jgi:hypothetical protein
MIGNSRLVRLIALVVHMGPDMQGSNSTNLLCRNLFT